MVRGLQTPTQTLDDFRLKYLDGVKHVLGLRMIQANEMWETKYPHTYTPLYLLSR